ncbi:MAG TPA: TerC family protein [Ktedonobacterales bacterium]|nr:TerC family protein [Ktedonobacterales bacterium]
MNPITVFILGAGGIVLIDIVLSGDNALVIGAAASRLPRGQRTLAIVWGGIAAIVFRIALTIGATEVLQIPLLQSVGALALLFIACRMLIPENEASGIARRASDRILPAIITILVADATMSIDNILAIGALAHGNIWLVTIGLLVSMTLLFVASALIARLIERLPILLDLAALVIAYTAANLILDDRLVNARIGLNRYALAVQIACVALVLAFDVTLRLWRFRHSASVPLPVKSAEQPDLPEASTPPIEPTSAMDPTGKHRVEVKISTQIEPVATASAPDPVHPANLDSH